MNLFPLPAFSDNYIWLLQHEGRALVVDPGEAAPVTEFLQAHQLKLECILVTHHHGDHAGGVAQLQAEWQAKVYGPAHEKLSFTYEGLQQGDVFEWHGLAFQTLDVPGHTAGHVAFWTQVPEQAPLLFCGDTLFSGGCGRLFEGTPAQMLHSLDQLAALPHNTRVCCAHEYTMSNLKFALAVEPHNADLIAYHAHCATLRNQQKPTLPAVLAKELQINPFLRTRQRQVIDAVQRFAPHTNTQEAEIFGNLRLWKNEFK
jgi:hydroxyacylglutathione hydrolase